MRRKDKEISAESAIKSIIEKANVCRLGMINGNKPYMCPSVSAIMTMFFIFMVLEKARKLTSYERIQTCALNST